VQQVDRRHDASDVQVVVDDDQAVDPALDHHRGGLVHGAVLGDAVDQRGHDVADPDRFAFGRPGFQRQRLLAGSFGLVVERHATHTAPQVPGQHVGLADHADEAARAVHHRNAVDLLLDHQAFQLTHVAGLDDRDHVTGHRVDHGLGAGRAHRRIRLISRATARIRRK